MLVRFNTLYWEGCLVFAKIKGHPYWPAELIEIINSEKTVKYKVNFFRDNTSALIKQGDMCLYTEYKKIHGKPKTDNFKNKKFNYALELAEIASKNSHPKEHHISSTTISPSNNSQEFDSHINLTHNSTLSEIEKNQQLKDVHNKIQVLQEQNPDDLETSLTLAAEAGTALLLENNKLKEEIHDMKQKFFSLTCQVSRGNNLAEVNLAEAKIEELENDKEILLSRNASLIETLNEVELQLEKERQLRIELIRNFEEQDNEREKLLYDSAKEMKQLHGIINRLKLNQDDKSDLTQTPKLASTSETQTDDPEPYVSNYSAPLLIELAQLKTRQDQLERSVVTLQETLHKQGEQTNSPTPSALTQNTPTAKSFPRSKNNNLSKSKKPTGKERNHFSVSLQVAKNKARLEAPANAETSLRTSLSDKLIKGTKREKRPPLSAKILPSGETFEDFVARELEALKNCSENYYFQTQQQKNKPISNTFPNQSQPPQIYIDKEIPSKNEIAFLEKRQPKQERHKNIQKYRIFINSTLKKRTQSQKSQFSIRI